MPNVFEIKFIDFLKKHNLYDEKLFKYICEQSISIDSQLDVHDFLLGSCQTVINHKRHDKLEQIIPCMPKLVDDKSVAIAIYTYVNALMLVPKINKTYKEDLFYHYFLPMFYEKIYILENPNSELLVYEENMRNILLKDGANNFKTIFNLVDESTCNYNQRKYDNERLIRKSKRLAKAYIREL